MTEAIFYILSNNAAVGAIIGSGSACRAYPVIVPESTTFPYVMFQQIASVPQNTMSGVATYYNSRVQVNCYGLLNKDAKDLSTAVKNALERVTKGVYSGVTVINSTIIDGGRDAYNQGADEDGAFWRIIEIDICHG